MVLGVPDALVAERVEVDRERYRALDRLDAGGALGDQGQVEDGSYQQVLDRWGLESEAVERSETNPPGLPKTEE